MLSKIAKSRISAANLWKFKSENKDTVIDVRNTLNGPHLIKDNPPFSPLTRTLDGRGKGKHSGRRKRKSKRKSKSKSKSKRKRKSKRKILIN